MNPPRVHVGFVSTRFSGTDGVSLETEKWANILSALGHECFYFAGESDRPSERSVVVPEAHFNHPQILTITGDVFDAYIRSSETTGTIQRLRYHIKQMLYKFVLDFALDVLIVENALSLPMNIPLGLAITELIAETRIPTIAHHHDFAWERTRFSVTSASDYVNAAFPPTLPSITHVVINSFAGRQLGFRTGVNTVLVPNVMDFDNSPIEAEDVSRELREALSIGADQHLLLQPTRIVPRKRIEHAIELVRRLELDSVLVITHQSGDEGSEYESYLSNFAELIKANVVFGADIVNHRREDLPNGRKVYSLGDAYRASELVTYPSTVEGFGNAFLEAIFYKRPLVINTYEIFRTDIQPKGFEVIGFEGFLQDKTIELARRCLLDPEIGRQMAEHNYEIGRRYYSFTSLESQLVALLYRSLGA
ncbi:MAG: glycosyltransferase family 1 protein [Anaerolineales bacterium]